MELLDQRCFHFPRTRPRGEQLPEDVAEHGADGKAFDALSSPVGGDGTRMAPPELLRVAFKKHGIEFPPEAVDVEIFE